ncbi:zinc-dependent peptidase [Halobacteriovorax sp.]|uniref:zinc-dependent peptidase n=1 Tax=Halobacteriovorax sp. TaxID=2020862 RepID=UPI003562C5C7
MHASVIFGTVVCLAIFFLIAKILYNLFTNSHFLKYEFPSGWRKNIEDRYPIFQKLSEEEQVSICKKTQILVAQKKVKGIEGLEIKINLRLSLAYEISFLNQLKKSANLYSKISPISVLPFSKYNEFKNRNAFTLYWDEELSRIYLETPENELLESSYYLWLKVDKRFSEFNDQQLLEIHKELSSGVWPISNEEAHKILNNKLL